MGLTWTRAIGRWSPPRYPTGVPCLPCNDGAKGITLVTARFLIDVYNTSSTPFMYLPWPLRKEGELHAVELCRFVMLPSYIQSESTLAETHCWFCTHIAGAAPITITGLDVLTVILPFLGHRHQSIPSGFRSIISKQSLVAIWVRISFGVDKTFRKAASGRCHVVRGSGN